MHFDLGLQGLGILLGLSLAYGAVAELIFWTSATRWIGPVTAAGAFVVGLFMSEVVVGTMTIDEIQPIIDGLAFDEAMLGGLVAAMAVALATWFVTRRRRQPRPTA